MKKVLLALALMASSVMADSPDAMEKCASMKVDEERLACFDKLVLFVRELKKMSHKNKENALLNKTKKASMPKEQDIELVSWDNRFESNKYSNDSSVYITYTLKNNLNSDIKLIDGTLKFLDLLGENVYSIQLEKDVDLKAKKTLTVEAGPFFGEARFEKLPKADKKPVLKIRKMVTTDNQIIEK